MDKDIKKVSFEEAMKKLYEFFFFFLYNNGYANIDITLNEKVLEEYYD